MLIQEINHERKFDNMKRLKRILTVLAVAALMVTTLALPALAAGSSWGTEFSAFPTQSTSSYSAGYTRAIQAFLCCCGSDEPLQLIREGGGIDGSYGSKTAAAVKCFQGTSGNGICDSATWRKIGNGVETNGTMTANGYTYSLLTTKVDGTAVYRVRTVNSTYEYSVNNVLSSGWSVFR